MTLTSILSYISYSRSTITVETLNDCLPWRIKYERLPGDVGERVKAELAPQPRPTYQFHLKYPTWHFKFIHLAHAERSSHPTLHKSWQDPLHPVLITASTTPITKTEMKFGCTISRSRLWVGRHRVGRYECSSRKRK